TTFKDFPSPDIARSLTGPDILQKHSINSLLLEHNEIISRGLPSPIDDNMSLADLLGGSQASSPTTASAGSSAGKGGDVIHHPNNSALGQQQHHHHQHHALQHTHHHLQQSQQNHQQQQQQHHNTTLGSFSSSSPLGPSLGGSSGVVRPTTVCDDSASSILSSGGGGHNSASGSVSSNPFNFSSLRIPSPSLNSPDLLMSGVLIGGGIAGSSSSSSSSSSGISCGGAGSAGSGQSPTTHSYYATLQQQQQHLGSGSAGGSTADALTSSSGSGGGFEGFRFDTDLMLGCGSGGINAASALTTETLKQRRRNISFDCSSPTNGTSSPGEGSSPSLTLLCSNSGRNYRNGSSYSQSSQQNTTLSHHHQQQQSANVQQFDLLSGGSNGSVSVSNGAGGAGGGGISSFDSNSTNNSALSLFGSGNGSLSRSHSPPDHTDTSNLLTGLESTSILDMLNYLTLGQSTNSSSQHQQSNGQLTPYTSTLNTLYQQHHQQQHQQQQHQQQSTGSLGSFSASTNGNSTTNLSGLNLGGTSGFTGEYDRLQNLQALNALRLLQQTQQLSQLQQLQFNQSLLPATTGNNGSSIFGNGGSGTGAISSTNGSSAPTTSSIGSNMSSTAGGNGNNTIQGKNWSSSQQQHMMSHRQGPSSPSLNGGGSGGGGGNGYADINLDRIARFHRSSAAHYDATCTWSGVLPPRSNRLVTYSSKIFLGGMPWDISEQSLVQIFKPFGSIKVEWPGKEQQATQPKGYVYIIFESDKQVKALLQSCTYTTPNGGSIHGNHGGGAGAGNYDNNSHTAINGGASSLIDSATSCTCATAGSSYDNALPHQQQQTHRQQVMSMTNLNKLLAPPGAKINFKISSKRIKSKDVEVIPWNIGDSNYVKSASQKLDPTKTVFVGALHGQLTAEGLAKIMNDLFDGVVYVGIDTDKYKYPLGSARVTFNNSRSYMKAVSAAFIEIRTSKFTKKLQVDPYLEDSLCSMCTVQHGPYFCREIMCFRYFCRSCWQLQHSREVYLQNHKPLTRNSKFTAIIGVGPQSHQQQSHTSGGSNSNSNHHLQQQPFDHSPYYSSNHHHHHHHHHHGGSSGRDSMSQSSHSSMSSHNHQYHHHNNNHHQQHQQQGGSRLSMLQQQQQQHHHHRALVKSPSPSMFHGNEGIGCSGNTSNTNSNSPSPIGVGNNARSNSTSTSSSCSTNSLNGSNQNVNCSAGNSATSGGGGGGSGAEHHVSCIGSLNLQQLSFVTGGNASGGSGGSGVCGSSGNGNGGSGLLI
uniref:RRM domain-containing protein n=1 Tax=Anopheles epiroticus TaxID=199890 RepID=A0A182P2X0_9DIPT